MLVCGEYYWWLFLSAEDESMKVIYQVYHHKDRNLRRNQGKREESFIVALNAEYFCFVFSVDRAISSKPE